MNSKITYVISFDFDTAKLKQSYGKPSWRNAYNEVKEFLTFKGFISKAGGLYYGHESVTQVTAVLAVVELSKMYPYIKDSVTDMRIFQLMNEADLRPALE